MSCIIQGRPDPLLDEWLLNTPLPAISTNTSAQIAAARVFAYSARDVAGASWPARVGETLTAVSNNAVTLPIIGGGAAKMARSDPAAAVAYIGSTNGFANPGTKDYLIEGIVFPPVGARYSGQQVIGGKLQSDYSTFFHVEYESATSEANGRISHYITSAKHAISAVGSLVPGDPVHFCVAGNRDEATTSGLRIMINGVLSGTGVDISSLSATDLAFDKPFSLLGTWEAATIASFNGWLVMLQGWYLANLIAAGSAGMAEVAAVMLNRYQMKTA